MIAHICYFHYIFSSVSWNYYDSDSYFFISEDSASSGNGTVRRRSLAVTSFVFGGAEWIFRTGVVELFSGIVFLPGVWPSYPVLFPEEGL